jgi:hypothetical protein
MTARQSRNTVLTFAALLFAGMTLGAPLATAATAPHARIPNDIILQAPTANLQPSLQIQETDRAFAPRFHVAQSRSVDPFADMHQE